MFRHTERCDYCKKEERVSLFRSLPKGWIKYRKYSYLIKKLFPSRAKYMKDPGHDSSEFIFCSEVCLKKWKGG